MSGSTSRRKGNKAEQAVAKLLRDRGWQARTSRSVQGVQGGPDIITDCPLAIEVKDQARMELAGWLDQAVAQADGKPAVVIHKRRGKGNPADWYATMRVDDLLALLRDVR
jgi:Holliday junction resolvase